ncbi:uncharacterized protein KY384_001987 [Bacidia gigantensis]|uniref:uncharacterized protein n=1 Tax=Bacidia gigantensis TaxID=2732470 RepID=UPI001D04E21D|nr:uncharacterized protein KY384_001987 [Bacidia gigantensis]KAG8533204.1 hypothetical protein KY384_001987 [Bacidia gigantensis]
MERNPTGGIFCPLQSRRMVDANLHQIRVFLKLENLQPSGSFKSRGIGNIVRQSLLTHPNPETTHFYSSSGGNAGLACVTAAQSLGRPATVVVPTSTTSLMIARIKTAGAQEVLQHGDSWREADEYLREVVMPAGRARGEDAVYVPPFDHKDVWDGNATLIEELYEQPDAIVCSVGGGGLFSGVQLGLERRRWDDTQVIAVETEGAASLARSLEAGKLTTLNEITSIATSLGAKEVAPKAFELAQRPNVRSMVLSEAEAAMGCWRLADDERTIVEPACGVNVALCYDGRLKRSMPWLTKESKVVIILCGGSNITLETLLEYKCVYGDVEKHLPRTDDIPSNVTGSTKILKVGLAVA